ncbi:MAG: thioredoxin domain-containing protein [Balneolaceae bacterium]
MTKFLSILFAGLLITSACNNADQPATNQSTAEAVSTNEVPAVPAKVVIEKYSDYQCPACAYYHSFLKQLKQDYGSEVRIDMKHFPLAQHPYAQIAARSAEAARVQGKFDEMHDLIFAGQQQWSRGNAEAIFIGYAESLELDVEKFSADMNSADMNRIVMANRRQGVEIGLSSTPTFVINGEKVESNPGSYPLFKELVESYMD